jgi:hypothetical protein
MRAHVTYLYLYKNSEKVLDDENSVLGDEFLVLEDVAVPNGSLIFSGNYYVEFYIHISNL